MDDAHLRLITWEAIDQIVDDEWDDMPPALEQFFAGLDVNGTVIEIGPGAGNIAKIMRATLPQARLSAIEVFGPYVELYALTNLYNQTLVQDVRKVPDWHWSASRPAVELTVWIEGPEHMPKKDALGQVKRLARLSRLGLLFSTPLGLYPQDGWTCPDGSVNQAEAHLSTWEREEWEALGAESLWSTDRVPCGLFWLRSAA